MQSLADDGERAMGYKDGMHLIIIIVVSVILEGRKRIISSGISEWHNSRNTNAFAHADVSFGPVRKCIAKFWYNVDRSDAFIVGKVIMFWHCIVSVNVEFFWIGICCFEKEVEIARCICFRMEP